MHLLHLCYSLSGVKRSDRRWQRYHTLAELYYTLCLSLPTSELQKHRLLVPKMLERLLFWIATLHELSSLRRRSDQIRPSRGEWVLGR